MSSSHNESGKLPEVIADEIRELSNRYNELDKRHTNLDSAARFSEDSAMGIYLEMYSLEKRMTNFRDRMSLLLDNLAQIDPDHPLVKDFLQQKKAI